MSTKTQAQKEQERNQRRKENANRKALEKEFRAQEMRKQYETNLHAENTTFQVLSKKERRLQSHLSITQLLAPNHEKPIISGGEEIPIQNEDPQSMTGGREGRVAVSEEPYLSTSVSMRPYESATSAASAASTVPTVTLDSTTKTLMRITEQRAKQDIETLAKKSAEVGPPAEVVSLAHQTFCEGVPDFLERLRLRLSGCVIRPGICFTANGKREEFNIDFQRGDDDHSYKLVARNGHQSQEIIISVSEQYKEKYTNELLERIVFNIFLKIASQLEEGCPNDASDLPLNYYNRLRVTMEESSRKEERQEKDLKRKVHEKELKKSKAEKEQERALAAKGVPSMIRKANAARDVAIKSGENRTKHSMK